MRGSAIRFSLPYQFESAPEERLECGSVAREPFGLPDGSLGGGARASKIEERGQDVLIDCAERGGWLRVLLSRNGRELVPEFEHHALRSLLADSGYAHQLLDFAPADVRDQIDGGESGENLDCQRWADAAHRDQLFEQRLLVLREESVER